jgi:signal transduction histidine kinase
MLGGRYTMESAPGKGTTVCVEIERSKQNKSDE